MRGGVGSWWAGLSLAALSGALLALSYGLHPHWWAAWLAPAPVLAAALLGPPGRGRWLGAFAGLGAGASTFGYDLMVMPVPVVLGLLLLRGALWSGGMTLAAGAARRLPPLLAVFVLPLFLAGTETLTLALSPHGSAGSLAYSQVAALPVIQVAALGGVPAVVFLVATGGSLAGFVLARLLGGPTRIMGAALAAGIVVLGGVGFGAARPPSAPGRTLPVALISTDRFAGEPRDWAMVWSVYGPAVSSAAKPSITVVLPEKIYRGPSAPAEASLSAMARQTGATIVAGIETPQDRSWANRALLAQPDGTVLRYDKQHLVPGLEARDRPGHAPLLMTVAGVPAGIAICKDMHFPGLGRAYRHAAVMLVPAWDFGADGWLSDRLTSVRGVESGFAVARATRQGISSISDRYGRVVAEAVSAPAVTVLTAPVPIEATTTPTLYGRIGDTFGWATLPALLALLAGGRLIARPREPSAGPGVSG